MAPDGKEAMAGEGSVALVVDLDRFIKLIPAGALILAKDFRDVSEKFYLVVDGACLVLAEMESQARSKEDHAAVLGGSQRFHETFVGMWAPTAGKARQCLTRKKPGVLCRAALGKLKGPLFCGTHVGSFTLTKVTEHLEVTRCGPSKRPEAKFSGRETVGKCAICQEVLKPKEARAGCVNCGYCAQASCIVAQLEGYDWSPVADRRTLELFCVGCVVERAGEVAVIRRILLAGRCRRLRGF
jgi:hypothetical protein